MRKWKHVVGMMIGVGAVVHCGKNPKKTSDEQASKDPPQAESGDYDGKKVTNTTYNFTLKPSVVGCEDFRKSLKGRNFEFTIPFKDVMGKERVEDAQFFFREVVCNPESERFILMASSQNSKGFNATFSFKFAKDAATLEYLMDDCAFHVENRMLGLLAFDRYTLNVEQQVKYGKIVNDDYCIPAVDKLAQAIVKDLGV